MPAIAAATRAAALDLTTNAPKADCKAHVAASAGAYHKGQVAASTAS
jgi:hypothetical protein